MVADLGRGGDAEGAPGVADPDQAWILGELIRYLEYKGSGALQFNDMGGAWVDVRTAVLAGTLRPADPGLAEVAARWDALIRFVSLQLGWRLGTEVVPALSRRELADHSIRAGAVCRQLQETATLSAVIRIPRLLVTSPWPPTCGPARSPATSTSTRLRRGAR